MHHLGAGGSVEEAAQVRAQVADGGVPEQVPLGAPARSPRGVLMLNIAGSPALSPHDRVRPGYNPGYQAHSQALEEGANGRMNTAGRRTRRAADSSVTSVHSR